jgi:D-hexose-6-phosphate mutarotase
MADFGDEEYRNMLCVEAGRVAPENTLTLASGSEFHASITLSVAIGISTKL